MGQSLSGLFVHAVFSTKNRMPLISKEWATELYSYLAGILIAKNCQPIQIGGTDDHLHLMFRLHPAISLSECLRDLKSGSSRWIHEKFPLASGFAWQNGYGAFSVSFSNVERVKRYIAEQEEHHKKRPFRDEIIMLMKKHCLEYDERYLFE